MHYQVLGANTKVTQYSILVDHRCGTHFRNHLNPRNAALPRAVREVQRCEQKQVALYLALLIILRLQGLREGLFWFSVSPPVRFEGAEDCVFFWTGDF